MARIDLQRCTTSNEPRPTMSHLVMSVLAVAAMCAMSGCWSYHEARGPGPDGDRSDRGATIASWANPTPPPPAEWPARDLAVARSLLDRTPETIPDFVVAPGFDESALTEKDQK